MKLFEFKDGEFTGCTFESNHALQLIVNMKDDCEYRINGKDGPLFDKDVMYEGLIPAPEPSQ